MKRRSVHRSRHRTLLALLLAGSLPAAGAESHRLLQLSLEELFQVKVTSVDKTAQSFEDIPAAVFVISAEEIRRSSATSLPELLRLAPGVDARQIDASHWAVSIRGFNSEFSDKLLVLVDGVSVFSSLFSGVHWDELDMDLAEIERIEVIRGPGATTWGVNAVNGVINIITRRADAGDSNRLSVAYGDNLRPLASLSHSGRLGNTLDYRVNAYFRRNGNSDGLTDRGDLAADDDWLNRRIELHGDLNLPGDDQLSLIVRGWNSQRRQISEQFSPVAPIRSHPHGGAETKGGTALLRLQQQGDNRSQQWQVYVDARDRDGPRINSSDKTIDLEFTQNLSLSGGSERVWGVGYRRLRNHTE
ncbi:MAG: TonB-dependent receptor plug domain-containing protein, partial [Gammaproteobacteria bacterium]